MLNLLSLNSAVGGDTRSITFNDMLVFDECPEFSLKAEGKNLKSKIYKENIYVMENKFFPLDTIYFMKLYNVHSKKLYKLDFTKYELFPHLTDRSYFIDFIFANSSLFLLIQFYVYEFKYDKVTDEFIYARRSELLIHNFKNIGYTDAELVLYSSDDTRSNIRNQESKSFYCKMGMDSLRISKVHYFEDPIGLEWWRVQPRELIDFHSTNFALSDATRYRIRIFGFDDLQFTIERDLDDEFGQAKLSRDAQNLGLIALYENWKKQSLIAFVGFLSEDVLLVCRTRPQNKDDWEIEHVFDIWKKYKDVWSLYKKDLIYYPYSSLDSKHVFTSQMLFSPYEFAISDNKILVSTSLFPFSVDYLDKMSIEEYMSKYEEYLLENELESRFCVFSLDL